MTRGYCKLIAIQSCSPALTPSSSKLKTMEALYGLLAFRWVEAFQAHAIYSRLFSDSW